MSLKIRMKTFNDAIDSVGNWKFAQAKRDGILVVIDSFTFYTSQANDITEQCRRLECFQDVAVLSGLVYGELFAKGLPASEVRSLLASGDTENQLQYEAFALTQMPIGVGLKQVADCLQRYNYKTPKYVCASEYADTWECLRAVGGNDLGDIEGLVFKNGNLKDFCKWKPVKTIDCVVTGLVAGKGKYSGMVGALSVSVANNEIAHVSGFSDEVRGLIDNNYVGRVVEVAYQYVGAGGRLRHPRFVRWRDDKTADECLPSQDGDLLLYWGDM